MTNPNCTRNDFMASQPRLGPRLLRLLPNEPPSPKRVPFSFSSTVDSVSHDADDEMAEYFLDNASEDECEDCGDSAVWDCVCYDSTLQRVPEETRRAFLHLYRAETHRVAYSMEARYNRRRARRFWFKLKQHVILRIFAFRWLGFVTETRCGPGGAYRAADAREFRKENAGMVQRKRARGD